MSDLLVRRVEPSDRPVMERLWLMFRHDMSEFQGQLPRPDGSYRTEGDLAPDSPGWSAFIDRGPAPPPPPPPTAPPPPPPPARSGYCMVSSDGSV